MFDVYSEEVLLIDILVLALSDYFFGNPVRYHMFTTRNLLLLFLTHSHMQHTVGERDVLAAGAGEGLCRLRGEQREAERASEAGWSFLSLVLFSFAFQFVAELLVIATVLLACSTDRQTDKEIIARLITNTQTQERNNNNNKNSNFQQRPHTHTHNEAKHTTRPERRNDKESQTSFQTSR
jgi:hypothetical protein